MYHVVATLKLDQRAIAAQIDKALARSVNVKRAAYRKAYGVFYNAKRAMLREFDRHLITQEIDSGPNAANISRTLDGYGNLFSFIGFYANDKPINRLRDLLEAGTTFSPTVYRKGAWFFRVTLPSKEAIVQASEMPWERGNSWAFEVEGAISGLSHYMYKRWEGSKSRSGMGLQLPYENWEDISFMGQPYITEILDSFRARVNKRD